MKLPVYYNSPELKTLGDFLSNEGISPAFGYKEDPNGFLFIIDDAGISNYEKIKRAYRDDEELLKKAENFFSTGAFNQIPLVPPIVFSIDPYFAKTDLYATQGLLVQQTENVNFFISEVLKQITLKRTLELSNINKSKGGVKITFPRLTVLIWCRGVNNGSLFNLSKFIDNINLSNGENGGAFNFSIAPIKGVFGGFWKPKQSAIKQSETEYRAIVGFEDKEMKTKDMLFHNLIQQNDLIFISFDDLPFQNFKTNFTVPYSEVQNKVWDCVGLVDKNTISISKENRNEININISGRDLTKLIIEDGSYFWATEFGLDGTIRFAGNRDNKIFRRVNVGPNSIPSYFNVANKGIENSLRFVLSQLANTGVVPNSIFSSYGDRRSTIFIQDFQDQEQGLQEIELSVENRNDNSFNGELIVGRKKELKEVVADGVWAITKIIIDPQIANLRLVDAGLFVEQGSLINYINRICQKPFVEFYTDTIGDQFYWIARKPPHNKQSYLDALGGVSLSDPKERLEDDIFTFREATIIPTLVETIRNIDTISVNLSFDETVYTWYKLESRYAFGGGAAGIETLALLPAVFLPTYTNIFGSRPLQTSTNYVNYIPSNNVDDENNYKNALEQAFEDLRWLIETHAYLPFTRKGQITINENRKIKKGMFVELESTGEVFLVKSVNHSMSIMNKMERRTVLQVERGMVKKYISGQEVENIGTVSYFNLIDLPLNIKRWRWQQRDENKPIGLDGKLKRDSNDTPIANWRENEKVIDFFIKRRQFDG